MAYISGETAKAGNCWSQVRNHAANRVPIDNCVDQVSVGLDGANAVTAHKNETYDDQRARPGHPIALTWAPAIDCMIWADGGVFALPHRLGTAQARNPSSSPTSTKPAPDSAVGHVFNVPQKQRQVKNVPHKKA